MIFEIDDLIIDDGLVWSNSSALILCMCSELILFCCSSYCHMGSPGGTWETAVDVLQSASI